MLIIVLQVHSHLNLKKQAYAYFRFWRVFVASRSISIVPTFHTWMSIDKYRSIWACRVVNVREFVCAFVFFFNSFDISHIGNDWEISKNSTSKPQQWLFSLIVFHQKHPVLLRSACGTIFITKEGIPDMSCDIQWLP